MKVSGIDPKLLKIVALAKHGLGGEKENAIRLVRHICQLQGLDYDEVMADDGDVYTERVLPVKWRTKAELRILAQVCWRFADTGDKRVHVAYNEWRKVVFVTTTVARFVETSQASAVYLAAFRKERRRVLQDLPGAFIARNRLYSDYPDEDVERPTPTLRQRQRAYREAQLAETIESVEFRKAIEG